MKENTVQKRQYIQKLHKIILDNISYSVLKKIKLSGNPNHIHTSPKFQRTNRKER